MLTIVRKILRLLEPRDVRQAGSVLALVILMALVEAVGIASIMPFLAVLANPEVVETNRYLAWAYQASGAESRNDFLFLLGAATFTLLVGSALLRALSLWIQLRFTFLQVHKIGLRLLTRYLGQPYHWFFNRHSSDFLVLILHEVSNVVQNLVYPSMLLVANTVSVTLILAILLVVDPVLALSAAAILGLVYAVVFVFARSYLERTGQERIEANQQRHKALHESFGSVKYVKVAGQERRFADRFRRPSDRMARRSITAAIIGELPSLAMQVLVFGGMLIVLLYLISAHGGVQGALPVVGLFAVAGYRLMPALQGLYKSLSQIRFALPSLDALLRDVAELGSLDAHDDQVLPDGPSVQLERALELQRVSYTYPGAEREALRAVDLRIDAYTKVGVVGTTGAGKTTLVDIVLGLLSPTSGRMLVDGQVVDRGNVRSWQKGVGYVPQNIFLLDDSVAMNVAFGLYPDEVDTAAVERAARLANLHEFVTGELPQGYATVVGEQGIRLSGGQRQRIGIARALYHDPGVLVFDEATSALDNVTEQVVMEAIHALGRTKTILIVAHRLSTVRHCDRIIVLEHGRVVADGAFDELVRDNEQFRSMVAGGR
jgi:ABC-type multidrug transport system fused ATPase/permease subunit